MVMLNRLEKNIVETFSTLIGFGLWKIRANLEPNFWIQATPNDSRVKSPVKVL